MSVSDDGAPVSAQGKKGKTPGTDVLSPRWDLFRVMSTLADTSSPLRGTWLIFGEPGSTDCATRCILLTNLLRVSLHHIITLST